MPILPSYHRGDPVPSDVVEEDVEVVIPPPISWIAIFVFMLVFILAVGSTEWGKPHLQMLLADWVCHGLVFVTITSIYGYQVWGMKIPKPEEEE
tara:strand:+ start:641 stop:922 length:282 start_codon:yes stop_codon:yes gene_type:complete